MVPKTSLALLLAGVGGALGSRERNMSLRRALSVLAAVAVLVIGAATLVAYGLDLGHLDPDRGRPAPGRPSPPVALALVFLGGAILLVDSRSTVRVRPPEWLALSAGFLAFLAMLGQLFGAGALYRLASAPVIGVAVPTAFGLMAIAVGLLLQRPTEGIMRVAASPGPGGILLRRLGLAAVLASTLLGMVLVRLLPVVGTESFPLVFATMVAALTGTSLVLIALTAMSLDSTHEALEQGRARTRPSSIMPPMASSSRTARDAAPTSTMPDAACSGIRARSSSGRSSSI
jgi:hypothetical protein